jgi:endonuclease/exonuclease/phosphatase family metal-dependent hydrolase
MKIAISFCLAFVVLTCDSAFARPVKELKVATFNLCHGLGKVDDGLPKAIKAIKDSGVDIVGLQESSTIANVLAKKLGWSVANVGNSATIISRYPITELFVCDKIALGARIQLSKAPVQDILFWSCHLEYRWYGPYAARDGKSKAQIMTSEQARTRQVQRILLAMKKQLKNADRVPVFLVGDFNVPSHLDWTAATAKKHFNRIIPWPATKALEKAGFKDSFRLHHPKPLQKAGTTWSTIFKTNEPQDRIDMIHVLGKGVRVVASRVLGESPKNKEKPYKNNPWPSDHGAVLTTVKLTGQAGLDKAPLARATLKLQLTAANSVIVKASSLTGLKRDWIAIYKSGAGDRDFLFWVYTEGLRSGSFQFAALAPGRYEARLFNNDSYHKAASAVFSVTGKKSLAAISTVKKSMTIHTSIKIAYKNVPKNSYFGLYKRGSRFETEPLTTHKLTKVGSGTVTLPGITKAGQYLLRLFTRDRKTLLAELPLTLK